MQYRTLGRTGLKVSILSLGSGGPNQFGQLRHVAHRDIVRLVRCALEHGINLFDSAADYARSESILGRALAGVPRDRYFLSSKISPRDGRIFLDGARARQLVERSLKRLRVGELDILYLHKVSPEDYEESVDRLAPLLQKLREEGLVRNIGITEKTGSDPEHRMLARALQDDLWDAVMVGYGSHRRSPGAAVLPLALERNVGVVAMRAARELVERTPGQRLALLGRTILGLVMSPSGPRHLPRRFRAAFSTLRPSPAMQEGRRVGSNSAQETATPAKSYAFAISHPAVATVLTGTTSVTHLDENVAAVLNPGLPCDASSTGLEHSRRTWT